MAGKPRPEQGQVGDLPRESGPMVPGWPLEPSGNGRPREMATALPSGKGHRTRLTGRLAIRDGVPASPGRRLLFRCGPAWFGVSPGHRARHEDALPRMRSAGASGERSLFTTRDARPRAVDGRLPCLPQGICTGEPGVAPAGRRPMRLSRLWPPASPCRRARASRWAPATGTGHREARRRRRSCRSRSPGLATAWGSASA
jgi:hypothetical protein